MQASATVQHDLLAGYTMEVTGFFVGRRTVSPPLSRRPVLSGSTTRNYGLELLIRKPLTRRLYGWVAYTLMRSDITIEPRGDAPGGTFPADFDQRHNLAVVASYKLPRNWQIGGRFRLVSGSPYTPVLGSLQYDGSFIPIDGEVNSARFPPFHQLDLRVDRRWIHQRLSVTTYLDVQNVYNRANVEALSTTMIMRARPAASGCRSFPRSACASIFEAGRACRDARDRLGLRAGRGHSAAVDPAPRRGPLRATAAALRAGLPEAPPA